MDNSHIAIKSLVEFVWWNRINLVKRKKKIIASLIIIIII